MMLILFKPLFYLANRKEFTFFVYYAKGDLLLKAKNYFEFSGEGGIQGCLLLALLMDSSKTLSIDAFVTLDKEIREDCRCGWKDISRDVPFSQLTMPQKKSPPSSRKRNKSEKSIQLKNWVLLKN